MSPISGNTDPLMPIEFWRFHYIGFAILYAWLFIYTSFLLYKGTKKDMFKIVQIFIAASSLMRTIYLLTNPYHIGEPFPDTPPLITSICWNIPTSLLSYAYIFVIFYLIDMKKCLERFQIKVRIVPKKTNDAFIVLYDYGSYRKMLSNEYFFRSS